MGIKTGSGGGNVRFFGINMKEGCITEGSGENKIKYEPGRTHIEGIPYRLDVKEDEFDGQKSLKANVYLKDTDGGPNMCVSWTVFTEAHEASSPGLKLLASLYAADTTKPVMFKPWYATKGLKLGNVVYDNDGGHVSFKQQDAAGKWQGVKPDYAGRGDKLPDMEERKVEGVSKPIKVKPGWNDILAALLEQLKARIEKENPSDRQGQAPTGGGEVDESDIDPADVAAAASRQGMGARA